MKYKIFINNIHLDEILNNISQKLPQKRKV